MPRPTIIRAHDVRREAIKQLNFSSSRVQPESLFGKNVAIPNFSVGSDGHKAGAGHRDDKIRFRSGAKFVRFDRGAPIEELPGFLVEFCDAVKSGAWPPNP